MEKPPENPACRAARPVSRVGAAGPRKPDDFDERRKQYDLETRRRRARLRGGGFVLGAALAGGISFGACVVAADYTLVGILALVTVFIAARFLLDPLSDCLPGRPAASTLLLVSESGPQTLGLLLGRLDAQPPRQEKELLWRTITDALQGISPEEADALPQEIRDRLNRRLAGIARSACYWQSDVAFAVAWLGVLEKIGDSREVGPVEALAFAETHHTAYRAIIDAAQRSLPVMKARSAARRPGRTLLRASGRPADAPETLLRSVALSNETAQRELLRSAEPNSAPPK